MGDLHLAGNHPAIGSRLERDEVHVWILAPELPANLDNYSRLLSREEQERSTRFLFPHLKRNFIVDHARLRLILGAYAGRAPETLAFAVNEYGKPELADGAGSLRFNLSHTHGRSVVAVCLDSPVGIDVEAVRPIDDWEGIAQSHFSAREIAALHASAESDRQHAFFRCWTRKEAFLKAHGFGLSIPLDSFAVSLARETAPALLECTWDPQETSRWSFFSLDLGEEFAGALAIPRGNWKLHFFDWAK